MREWVLSIVSVCIIEILFFILVPNGKLSGIIKSVFSFVLILVLISPITKISSGNISFEDYFGKEIVLQDGYIDYVKDKNEQQIKENIKVELNNLSYSVNDIEVYFEGDNYYVQNLNKIEISINGNNLTDKEHINISEQIKNTLNNKFSINKESILVKFV